MENNQSPAPDFVKAPDIVKIDTKVVKKMVGSCLFKIDGVLDVKESVTDVFKSDEDPTRGINVSINDHQQVRITVKIITEMGKNIPSIVNQASKSITEYVQGTAGLEVEDLSIEVVDTLTKEEFDQREHTEKNMAPISPVVR